ncbi:MAG: sigma-E processing peptidase SpoIIGA, partial [Butyricicoccus sp.]
MRVIYVDVLAGVNLAMDYLLLAAAARLSGTYCTRPRLLLGAALGAGYAVASCLDRLAWLGLLPVKAAVGFLMVRAAFGARRGAELARLTALFWLVSCAVAGGALALGKVSDAAFFAGGGYYLDVPFRV